MIVERAANTRPTNGDEDETSKARVMKSATATPNASEAENDQNARATRRVKQIVAAVTRGEGEERQTYWTRIGTAFQNRDKSWNQLFAFCPTDPKTTIQLRDIEPREP